MTRALEVSLAALALAMPATARAASPAFDYTLHCQGCHLENGAGTPDTVPPLAAAVGKFVRVPGGREFLVRVPGVAQSSLDDAALAELLNWMLRRYDAQDLPRDFAPYTAEEVGRTRRNPLTDLEGARRALRLDAPPVPTPRRTPPPPRERRIRGRSARVPAAHRPRRSGRGVQRHPGGGAAPPP